MCVVLIETFCMRDYAEGGITPQSEGHDAV